MLEQKETDASALWRTGLHAAPGQACCCFHVWRLCSHLRVERLLLASTADPGTKTGPGGGSQVRDQGPCCPTGRKDLAGRETGLLLALGEQAEQNENHCWHLQRDPGTQTLLKCNSIRGKHFLMCLNDLKAVGWRQETRFKSLECFSPWMPCRNSLENPNLLQYCLFLRKPIQLHT